MAHDEARDVLWAVGWGGVVAWDRSTDTSTLYTMADDGCVFVLGPPTRFDCGYKEYTDCMGMRFAFVVGRESEQGTVFDLDGIQRVTDQALSAIG